MLLVRKVTDMPGESVMFGSQATPMSLNDFQMKVKHYWRMLKYEETALSDAYNTFALGQEIWPDQCKRIVALLRRMKEPVYKFGLLLENPTQLPSSVVSHRRSLLMSLG